MDNIAIGAIKYNQPIMPLLNVCKRVDGDCSFLHTLSSYIILLEFIEGYLYYDKNEHLHLHQLLYNMNEDVAAFKIFLFSRPSNNLRMV